MGLAIDTILAATVNPGAGPTAATVTASGDSLTVRNFGTADRAYLEQIIRMGTTAGFAQVRSPRLHDNVSGIRITPGESPSVFALPAYVGQVLYSGDALIAELSGGAAETDIMALSVFYSNLQGSNARLHSWGDIAGNIAYVKPVRVAVTSSATIGAWTDTAITTTENLLEAGSDYAVLGYTTNTALGVVGVRGQETGNLRVCGCGATSEFATSDYFIYLSEKTGRPHIPVFNSNNAGNVQVSVAAATASVSSTVELILAQLSSNLSS